MLQKKITNTPRYSPRRSNKKEAILDKLRNPHKLKDLNNLYGSNKYKLMRNLANWKISEFSSLPFELDNFSIDLTAIENLGELGLPSKLTYADNNLVLSEIHRKQYKEFLSEIKPNAPLTPRQVEQQDIYRAAKSKFRKCLANEKNICESVREKRLHRLCTTNELYVGGYVPLYKNYNYFNSSTFGLISSHRPRPFYSSDDAIFKLASNYANFIAEAKRKKVTVKPNEEVVNSLFYTECISRQPQHQVNLVIATYDIDHIMQKYNEEYILLRSNGNLPPRLAYVEGIKVAEDYFMCDFKENLADTLINAKFVILECCFAEEQTTEGLSNSLLDSLQMDINLLPIEYLKWFNKIAYRWNNLKTERGFIKLLGPIYSDLEIWEVKSDEEKESYEFGLLQLQMSLNILRDAQLTINKNFDLDIRTYMKYLSTKKIVTATNEKTSFSEYKQNRDIDLKYVALKSFILKSAMCESTGSAYGVFTVRYSGNLNRAFPALQHSIVRNMARLQNAVCIGLSKLSLQERLTLASDCVLQLMQFDLSQDFDDYMLISPKFTNGKVLPEDRYSRTTSWTNIDENLKSPFVKEIMYYDCEDKKYNAISNGPLATNKFVFHMQNNVESAYNSLIGLIYNFISIPITLSTMSDKHKVLFLNRVAYSNVENDQKLWRLLTRFKLMYNDIFYTLPNNTMSTYKQSI